LVRRPPTKGRVYVGAKKELDVYGLLAEALKKRK
jgi:hypothetical protein